VKKSFNIQELLHHKSKQADAPLLLKSFPKRPRMPAEASWFNGSHKYKQNKTTNYLCFINRFQSAKG
jgi:hypothetical protein